MKSIAIITTLICFSQAAPAINPLFVAWQDVQFQLYTRSNPTTAQILGLYDSSSIKNSNFKNSRETRYIIHGFQNSGKSDVNIKIRDAYLQKGDFNVIVVDWSKGANTLNYNEARNRIDSIAATVAEFIEILSQDVGQKVGAIQLIGHSLGAHTAGLTAKYVQKRGLGKVPKIVGLDPAMPGFSIGSPESRLASTDANYVEVFHTNSRMLGFDYPVGHVDYYPNYGFTQPGCGIDVAGTCAHGRAYQYFAESLNSAKGFVAYKCSDYYSVEDKKCAMSGTSITVGGEPLSTGNIRGIFYGVTNNKAPFAI